MQKIGLGVIGINPTNMGSTMSLLSGEADLRYELRALCAKRENTLAKYAQDLGVSCWTTEYQELIKQKDIDVIAVFSPDHLHAEQCLVAIEAGKHVICTKPMVTSLADAQKLVQAVRRSGVKFLVGQTMRFDLQFLTLQKMFEDGELGTLMASEAHYIHDMRPVYEFTPWRLNEPQDLMFGGVVHPVDILRCFSGDVAEVHAYGSKGLVTPEFPQMNNFFLNLKFENGQISRVMGLYDIIHPPMPMMQVTLYGSEGTVRADFTDNEPGSLAATWDKMPVKQPMNMTFPPEADSSVYGHGQTVIRYMRHFQDCLEFDREPCPNVIDGAKSVAVGVAAWESIRTGQPVQVFNDF